MPYSEEESILSMRWRSRRPPENALRRSLWHRNALHECNSMSAESSSRSRVRSSCATRERDSAGPRAFWRTRAIRRPTSYSTTVTISDCPKVPSNSSENFEWSDCPNFSTLNATARHSRCYWTSIALESSTSLRGCALSTSLKSSNTGRSKQYAHVSDTVV